MGYITYFMVMMVCDKTYNFVCIVYTWQCIATIQQIHVITAGNKVSSETREQVEIKMKENLAYEVPPSRIKMTENQAYSTLPIANRPQFLFEVLCIAYYTEDLSMRLSTYSLFLEENNITYFQHYSFPGSFPAYVAQAGED